MIGSHLRCVSAKNPLDAAGPQLEIPGLLIYRRYINREILTLKKNCVTGPQRTGELAFQT